MATYVIGDIQGCYKTFLALLEKIKFQPQHDNLWLTGDLVNRGPGSLAVLRWVYEYNKAIVVLGNHDLHLLAIYAGAIEEKSHDTLSEVLDAPDVDQLCTWLRKQPLLHYDTNSNAILCHAGVYPLWDLPQAQQYANEVESILKGRSYKSFFKNMYGNEPACWNEQLQGWDRLRFITNAYTRMRLVSIEGCLDLTNKGRPETTAANYYPWFNLPRMTGKIDILFGHWAALECRTGKAAHVYALDSGCFWGNDLTALRLEDKIRFTMPNIESTNNR